MDSGTSSVMEDKVDSMLQHLATYHGVCSRCGAHEIRMKMKTGSGLHGRVSVDGSWWHQTRTHGLDGHLQDDIPLACQSRRSKKQAPCVGSVRAYFLGAKDALMVRHLWLVFSVVFLPSVDAGRRQSGSRTKYLVKGSGLSFFVT